MTTFIYGLQDPRTGEIRYIGKADDLKRRMRCHRYEAGRLKTHRCNWLFSLQKEKLRPILVILDIVPKLNWQFFERAYIKVYRECGVNLVNGTDGGEGTEGVIHTPENRKKFSLNRAGKPLSTSTKEKIGASNFNVFRTDNVSGITGVSWDSVRKKWAAYANRRKKRTYLGRFESFEEAKKAREDFVKCQS